MMNVYCHDVISNALDFISFFLELVSVILGGILGNIWSISLTVCTDEIICIGYQGSLNGPKAFHLHILRFTRKKVKEQKGGNKHNGNQASSN